MSKSPDQPNQARYNVPGYGAVSEANAPRPTGPRQPVLDENGRARLVGLPAKQPNILDKLLRHEDFPQPLTTRERRGLQIGAVLLSGLAIFGIYKVVAPIGNPTPQQINNMVNQVDNNRLQYERTHDNGYPNPALTPETSTTVVDGSGADAANRGAVGSNLSNNNSAQVGGQPGENSASQLP